MAKEGLAILGTIAGIIMAFTFMAGGTIGLGTSPTGPEVHLGFSGPQYRG